MTDTIARDSRKSLEGESIRILENLSPSIEAYLVRLPEIKQSATAGACVTVSDRIIVLAEDQEPASSELDFSETQIRMVFRSEEEDAKRKRRAQMRAKAAALFARPDMAAKLASAVAQDNEDYHEAPIAARVRGSVTSEDRIETDRIRTKFLSRRTG